MKNPNKIGNVLIVKVKAKSKFEAFVLCFNIPQTWKKHNANKNLLQFHQIMLNDNHQLWLRKFLAKETNLETCVSFFQALTIALKLHDNSSMNILIMFGWTWWEYSSSSCHGASKQWSALGKTTHTFINLLLSLRIFEAKVDDCHST